MQNFRQLKVWQKGHQLTLDVYGATTRFPRHEMFGLTSQLRRATSSVPSNLAEGCGRPADADFGRFTGYAMGSASEAEYQLLLAHDLGYLPDSTYAERDANAQEVKRMLSALMRTLQKKQR
ncbi:MAG TPA: four helix bundle protein [Phycisphaerae bacterium]|nr:four helix bundle protein [Phycisphaerae bacterium]